MTTEQVQTLNEQGSFRSQPIRGELLETHISWILVSSEYVFKLKKPVKFSFLDFSQLRQRKFYCQREVELNSRLCDIYLDVQPIRYHHEKYCIGPGPGDVVEYAVRMRKCDPEKRMDKLLGRHEVSERDVQRIASKLAGFHQKAEVIHQGFSVEKFREDYNDLSNIASWAAEHLGKDFRALIRNCLEKSNHFLENHQEHFQQRAQDGWHRDVHGDLHSGNIFLYDDPVIFDCIEFNDSFRQIDVLNELAFFCMDLEFHGEHELSESFLEHYLEQNPVMQSLRDQQLFLYYKSYRANIRAKVAAYGARGQESQEALQQVERYLHLLREYWRQLEE